MFFVQQQLSQLCKQIIDFLISVTSIHGFLFSKNIDPPLAASPSLSHPPPPPRAGRAGGGGGGGRRSLRQGKANVFIPGFQILSSLEFEKEEEEKMNGCREAHTKMNAPHLLTFLAFADKNERPAFGVNSRLKR
jgi:hypothetical protein